jgi:hypothetical protein
MKRIVILNLNLLTNLTYWTGSVLSLCHQYYKGQASVRAGFILFVAQFLLLDAENPETLNGLFQMHRWEISLHKYSM